MVPIRDATYISALVGFIHMHICTRLHDYGCLLISIPDHLALLAVLCDSNKTSLVSDTVDHIELALTARSNMIGSITHLTSFHIVYNIYNWLYYIVDVIYLTA